MRELNPKGPRSVWLHLYDMCRAGYSRDTVQICGCQRSGEGEMGAQGAEFLYGVIKMLCNWSTHNTEGSGCKGTIKVALIILCHHSISLCLFGNVPQHIIAPVNDSKRSWKWQVFPNTKESNAGSRGFTLQGMHLEEKRSKPQQLNWHSEVIVHPKQGNFKAFLQKREKNY